MKQEGFVNIVLIVLVVILAGVAGYFALVNKNIAPVVDDTIAITDKNIQVGCDADNNARIKIINTFRDGWIKFQEKFSPRPVLGSVAGQPWSTPDYYQFIGNSRMLIAFEDGHVLLDSIIQYKCDKGNAGEFSSLETYQDNNTETEWNNFYSQYGDKNYGVHTYTKSIFKGGQVVKFDDWTEIPENIFVYPPKGF